MRHASLSVLFISIAYVVIAQKFDIGAGQGGGGGGGGSFQPANNNGGNRIPNRKDNQNHQTNQKPQTNEKHQNQDAGNQNQNKDHGTSLCLDNSVIQKAALSDGILDKANPDKFAPSLTSSNNFINFCVGATITDGTQNDQGSCNPTPMGSIPSAQKMPSVKIKSPTPSQNIQPKTPFEIQIGVKNLETGYFSSPKNTYYLAPQQLNSNGEIKGHVHVTIQQLSEQDDTPDTSQFQFFKGISDPANNGILKTTVTDGLPAGRYRLATITSTVNHQVVAVPVANRGTVEDAIYFSVGGSQSGGGGGGSGLNNGGGNNIGVGNNVGGGNGGSNGGVNSQSNEKSGKRNKQGGGKSGTNRQTSNPTSNDAGTNGRILKTVCTPRSRRQKRQESKTKKKLSQTTRRSLPSQVQRPSGLNF